MGKAGQIIIRLLVIDDHELFRESVARLLQAEPGFEVVAHCGSGSDALRVLKSSEEVDIILLDLDLGHEKGAQFLDLLKKTGFGGRVLLVTAGVNETELPSLIRKGISGVFLKHGSPASLIRGIKDTFDGKTLFDQAMLRGAFEYNDAEKGETGRAKLTEREREVLSFVFEGFANKQIADKLGISESAVKASLQQLFAKTGVRTRSQLVRVALECYRDQL
jgi:two-component system, NarL family, nitrate/nitrite response regulator NarL